ncbi:MAG TPA: hypothetical protein VFI77_00365 [Gemmatimonadales bacterium]|nr:hypothetical protein [Gemmatimonadales bacterium]
MAPTEPSVPGAPSRELIELLIELATGLQKRAMYPEGHPMLLATVERVLARLAAVLGDRPSLGIGVARTQLLVDGCATDPHHLLCRELAARLHRHRIASLRIEAAIEAAELDQLLARLAVEPGRGQRPLGLAVPGISEWPHVTLQATGYDRLGLRGDGTGDESAEEPSGGERLWLELARLSLDGDWERGAATDGAADMAAALSRRIADPETAASLLAGLSRLAESIQGEPGEAGAELRARVSTLVSLLEPGALERLIAAGSDAERERFTAAATAVLTPQAVVDVMDAAASATRRTISPHLLRLLRKLGHLAGAGPDAARAAADVAVRRHAASLLTDWRLDDPNPTQYTGVLEAMADRNAMPASDADLAPDPLVVLWTALEVGVPEPRGSAAALELVASGRTTEVLETLTVAGEGPATEPIWRAVGTPEALRAALLAQGIERTAVRTLIRRLGVSAVDPLLDLLSISEDQATRAAALGELEALGTPAAARAAERLAEAPWYVQRNLLALLGRVRPWPDNFSPATWATHADARVRREAIKLMLDLPAYRDDGLARGLADTDPGITAVTLGAALESCPASVLPLIERMARDPVRRSAHRVMAIRVLARSRTARALESLASLAVTRTRWLRRQRLSPKSPEVLAAIAGLAAHWPTEPRVQQVLAEAERHADADIRAAARRSA